MNELFRFVSLRPAQPADPKRTVPSRASSGLVKTVTSAGSPAARKRALAGVQVYASLDDYDFGKQMAALGGWALDHELGEKSVTKKLAELVDEKANDLAEKPKFKKDVVRLDDTLMTLKFLSDRGTVDTDALSSARIGYDLVEQLAAGGDAPRLRNVVIDLPKDAPPEMRQNPEPPPARDSSELDKKLAAVAAARNALRDAIRAGLDVPTVGKAGVSKPSAAELKRAAALENEAPAGNLGRATMRLPSSTTAPPVSDAGTASWMLSAGAIREMPNAAKKVVAEHAGDLRQTPATALALRLQGVEAQLQVQKAEYEVMSDSQYVQIGSAVSEVNWASKYGLGTINDAPGDVKPVGVGDLLIVREHIKQYEGGEVGHIENILRSESLSRDTRRLDHTEQTYTTETQTDTEEERDQQSTDRFSLKRETAKTVNTDAQIKAGVSVDAKYGPMVEVKAYVDGSYQQTTQESTKQATEFSKDVVSRSVSKVATKVRELKTTITLQEFEEKYHHGFDNTQPAATNISGVYQFVDKVSEAQIYNYGKRLLFDVMVPEPAAFYIWAQQKNVAANTHLEMPAPLTIQPSDLNAGNYQTYALKYGATGIDPPPPPYKTYSQGWDATIAGDPHLFTKTGTLVIDEGYAAIQATAVGAVNYPSDQSPAVWVAVGGNGLDLAGSGMWATTSLPSETVSLAVGVFASKVNAITVTLEILAEATDRANEVWQEKAYAAIQQAYVQKKSDYDKALAEMQTQQAFAVTGRNPGANKAVIAGELRKACIEQLTTQHYDAFGSIGSDSAGRPELDLARLGVQGPFIRFFEQAFEWERIVYFFYPYFWADKDTWAQRSLLDDTADPVFADFLRSGAARAVFPVRPGFEAAVIHYLETGLIWNGADPPDISSSLYLPIVEEIAEADQRPGDEVAVGDPWEVRVPTELVHLRADDQLPKWKKSGDSWVPDN